MVPQAKLMVIVRTTKLVRTKENVVVVSLLPERWMLTSNGTALQRGQPPR